mmetsp:Transcript_133633/g.249967  ORF Transcript_133633/g.249967 Transcript_133633/m.249967 type:complete len:394 (+) Transcript_133633:71-1252(+)
MGLEKIGLIAGFLLTGSINTVTKKWQFQTCGPTNSETDSPSSGICPEGEKQFHKPWTQNIQMFMGESLLLTVFLARRPARHRARAAGTQAKVPFYIFAVPAACDILGTGVGGVGMLYISASVWQMMRGSLIIFTCFVSMIFLKKKLYAYNWVAVLVAAFGLALVGCSAVLDESSGEGGSSNVFLGILFTVVSQMFAATQMVVEELYVKGYKAPPEQVVGTEGVWGILYMCIILFVMYWIPGSDAGSYENAVDSLHMLGGSGILDVFVISYLVSISFFNFFGVTISGKLSAVHRTINDALRTMIIWAVEIFVFYALGSETYGKGWRPHSWLQLLGFLCLISANFINHAILKLPCLTYPAPQAPTEDSASVASSQRGVSLIVPTDGKTTDGPAKE